MRAVAFVALSLFVADPARGKLPAAIKRDITRAYSGWRFATLMPSFRSVIDREHSSEWISGDFDGDGRRDYAVQIVRQSPRDSAQLVIAFLRRGHGYRSFVVMAHGVSSATYLGLARKGDRVNDYDYPMGDRSVLLRTDAIDVIYAEQAAETCLYARRAFHCFVSAD